MKRLSRTLLRSAAIAGLVIVACCAGVSLWSDGRFPADSTRAFVDVFRTVPPPGVSNLSARRWYCGMFDPDGIALRFTADAAAIEQIIKPLSFRRNDSNARRYESGELNWESLWATEFPPNFSGERLEIPAPIAHPVVFERLAVSHDILCGFSRLVWDPATGNAWLLRIGDEPGLEQRGPPTTQVTTTSD